MNVEFGGEKELAEVMQFVILGEFCDEDVGLADGELVTLQNLARGGRTIDDESNDCVVGTILNRDRAGCDVAFLVEAREEFEQFADAVVEKDAEVAHHRGRVTDLCLGREHAHRAGMLSERPTRAGKKSLGGSRGVFVCERPESLRMTRLSCACRAPIVRSLGADARVRSRSCWPLRVLFLGNPSLRPL